MALLPVSEARARMLDGAAVTAAEPVAIADAAGRILAADLIAPWDQPPFTASAMDGYAVQATGVAALPVTLKVAGQSAAGRPWSGTLRSGEAVRIFTGAPLPPGADAIVIQENTTRAGDLVTITSGTPDAAHVRPQGGDFQRGARLIAAGTRLAARSVLLAAAAGYAHVPVRRKPVVAILATGDELVEPGETPAAGQIISSNPYGLAPMIAVAGGAPRLLGIARDTKEALAEKIATAADADILVTIGGASVGDHDLVAPALEAAGTKIGFWKIAMRPGKPMMFGQRGTQRVLGLPGNPVSSMICARVFVVPLIRRLLGLADGDQQRESARLTHALEANGPRMHFMRATLARDASGNLLATALPNQDSSLMSSLAAADALIVRDVAAPALAAGTPVEIMRLDF